MHHHLTPCNTGFRRQLWEKRPLQEQVDKKLEFRSFLLLAVVLGPVLAVAIVGGYGFVVWFSQMLLGPPGA